jgi:hypothetical protein
MTDAEKYSNRKDSPTGKKIQRFQNKGDLLKESHSKGVSAKGRKDELQILCKQKTWVGRKVAKGMLQILWE